jgi:hypothetical protein
MIIRSSASGSHHLYGGVERISRFGVARNLRHVNLHIKPKRTPIFGEVSIAARRDLNSGHTFSRILPTRVEGTTRVVRLVVLAVVEFDDVFLNDQFKQSRENISAQVASESLDDPEELGQL